MLLQILTARIITNYDNKLLQFAIGRLLQITTRAIRIYDRYYNSRRLLLQFTTTFITINDRYCNSRRYYNSRQFNMTQSCATALCLCPSLDIMLDNICTPSVKNNEMFFGIQKIRLFWAVLFDTTP